MGKKVILRVMKERHGRNEELAETSSTSDIRRWQVVKFDLFRLPLQPEICKSV